MSGTTQDPDQDPDGPSPGEDQPPPSAGGPTSTVDQTDLDAWEKLQPDESAGDGHDAELEEEFLLAKKAPQLSAFYDNLAAKLDDAERETLVTRYLQYYDDDKQARDGRDRKQQEALLKSGIANKGAPSASNTSAFDGGSIVAHPTLLKAGVELGAALVNELLPADGPVKAKQVGDANRPKSEKADRKVRHMNWQFTDQVEEAVPEIERALSQVWTGEQGVKLWWDEGVGRPKVEYIPGERIIVPYDTGYFYGARRIHVEQPMALADVEARMRAGMYREVELAPSGLTPDTSQTQDTVDEMAGSTPAPDNPDNVRNVVWMSVVDDLYDEGTLPYVMEIDENSRELLCLYRNWEEDDDTHARFDWVYMWGLLPGRDAYGTSLYDLIGGLSVAATGALRALLDAGLVNTIPSLLKLRGINFSGQTKQLELCSITELEGATGDDPDIRKLAMPVPFHEPSSVLFQLLGFLTEQADSVARTALNGDPTEEPGPTPVGTQLARIEQGLKVYKWIHGRNHRTMARLLRGLHRLNKVYLDEKRLVQEAGERLAFRADYEGPFDVRPVSDPNIFSEQQRMAQNQLVAQRATAMVQFGIYDLRKVEERILSSAKVPNYEEVLTKEGRVDEQNAATENLLMCLGRPVAVYPEQDHLAHIQVLVTFMSSQDMGMNPIIAPRYMPAALQHLADHLAMWYLAYTYQVASHAVGQPLTKLLDPKSTNVKKQVDRLLASTSALVLADAKNLFAKVGPVVAQAKQLLQQLGPPPMMDPGRAQLAVAQMTQQTQQQKNQQEAAQAQAETQLDAAKLQAETQQEQVTSQQAGQRQQQEAALGEASLAQKAQADQQDNATKLQTTQADNDTALTIAEAKTATGQGVNVSDGEGLKPSPRP